MIAPQSRPSPVRIEPLEHRIAPAVALVDLGSVNGTDGFKIDGVAADDLAGISVSGAGDVNGDGRQDFIVGASDVNLTGANDAGASYVVFGRATSFGASFDLSSLDGTSGFRLTGETGEDFAGFSVSRAGDVNGDGFGDLVIGAYGSDPSGSNAAGAVYVVYGKRTFAATPTPGFSITLGAAGQTKIIGEAAGDLLGFSVAAAGDVNRDGRADLIIGAPGAGNFTGASYVVFGRTGGLGASVSLAGLTGTRGFEVVGEALDDNSGSSVNGAGDVNGDGFADLIVGAYSAGNDDAGAAYVIFGRASGFAASINVASLNGANGFKIAGELADDFLGSAASGAGDVNGDGFGDLVIGARTADRGGLSDSGSAYVVFGKRTGFTATFDLSTLTGTNGFEIPGHETNAQLGTSVARAGDLNTDRFADILIGGDSASPGGDSGAGSAYAIFGKRDGFPASLDLDDLDGINGFRIDGDAANDAAGLSVAAAGDLNRDGFGDLLVGAPGGNAAYVIYGTALPVRFSADGRTAVLTDTDGDTIVVKVSKGRLGQADFTLGANDRGLVALNLGDDGTEFQGASVSISAVRPTGGAGDGLVNVDSIDARGIDLVTVAVKGSLGFIDAGDANLATTGLARLSVRGLGAQVSTIDGRLGSFSSAGDVLGVLEVDGTIGAVVIAGDLDGSAGGTAAGLLRATGSIGNVAVAGSILGGADTSGLIAGVKLGKVAIGVDLSSADPAKPVSVFAEGATSPINGTDAIAIASLSVKGNVLNARILADTTDGATQSDSNAAIGNVVVRGTWTDSLLHSTGQIGNVTVLGDFTGTNTLGIVAGRRIGALSFGGDVKSDNSATPLLIVAAGIVGSTTAAGNLAMPSILVRGDVTNTWFAAGYGELDFNNGLGPINGAGSIGGVVVDGTWNGSNLIAGVTDGTADGFGRNDSSGASRIAAIVIRGAVTNNGIADSHFGITAQTIVAANITGVRLPLSSTPGQSFDLGTTGDVKLVEV
jgi:hypothetical protein